MRVSFFHRLSFDPFVLWRVHTHICERTPVRNQPSPHSTPPAQPAASGRATGSENRVVSHRPGPALILPVLKPSSDEDERPPQNRRRHLPRLHRPAQRVDARTHRRYSPRVPPSHPHPRHLLVPARFHPPCCGFQSWMTSTSSATPRERTSACTVRVYPCFCTGPQAPRHRHC